MKLTHGFFINTTINIVPEIQIPTIDAESIHEIRTFSPLHFCSTNTNREIAQQCFKAYPYYALVRNKSEDLPIHIACTSGNPVAIDMLKTYPYLLNEETLDGLKPLQLTEKKINFLSKCEDQALTCRNHYEYAKEKALEQRNLALTQQQETSINFFDNLSKINEKEEEHWQLKYEAYNNQKKKVDFIFHFIRVCCITRI